METPKWKLKLQLKAQSDIREIAQIHRNRVGVASARRITDRIYKALERLQRFPFSGPPLEDEDLRAAGYRYILVKKYLVIYGVSKDIVRVYRIVYGRMDYPSLFKPPAPED